MHLTQFQQSPEQSNRQLLIIHWCSKAWPQKDALELSTDKEKTAKESPLHLHSLQMLWKGGKGRKTGLI